MFNERYVIKWAAESSFAIGVAFLIGLAGYLQGVTWSDVRSDPEQALILAAGAGGRLALAAGQIAFHKLLGAPPPG